MSSKPNALPPKRNLIIEELTAVVESLGSHPIIDAERVKEAVNAAIFSESGQALANSETEIATLEEKIAILENEITTLKQVAESQIALLKQKAEDSQRESAKYAAVLEELKAIERKKKDAEKTNLPGPQYKYGNLGAIEEQILIFLKGEKSGAFESQIHSFLGLRGHTISLEKTHRILQLLGTPQGFIYRSGGQLYSGPGPGPLWFMGRRSEEYLDERGKL